MAALKIPIAPVFQPLTQPARYKGAFGGRGSGKSHFFAEFLITKAVMTQGLRAVCIREVQKDLRHSAKLLIEDKLTAWGMEGNGFRIQREVIETPKGGLIIFQGMQDHTASSIKSLEGMDVAWVEEAQTLSHTSLQLLRPTIRKEASELWFSWNPRRKSDPVDQLLRGAETPTGAVVVEANWDGNIWFPEELEQERLDCLRITPEQYPHIWEGDYATVLAGAYYARHLAEAKAEGRIGIVPKDPLMQIRAYWDIGGAGKQSDATAIWIAQFVGMRIHVLDYYEAAGQPLGAHLNWLRANGYQDARMFLPHDASRASLQTGIRYEDAVREAGFVVETVPNQGAGARLQRVEAGRRRFPSIWFHQPKCQPGLDALGWYHERLDETRQIGLGPENDWSGHACLVHGTMITTETGLQAIETIKVGEKVWTPSGLSLVTNAGPVKMASELLEISTSRGTVLCTPEHKILTNRGFVMAKSLMTKDVVLTGREWKICLIALFSRAANIGFRDCITVAAENACIKPFSNMFTGLFQSITRFITSMVSGSTTTPPILSPNVVVNTSGITRWSDTGTEHLSRQQRKPLQMLRHGIDRRKGESGTGSMGRAHGSSANGLKSPVRSALGHFGRLILAAPCTATSIAKIERYTVEKSASCLVYDLTIADHHCYRANGLLVSNSDAFGMMCEEYSPPQKIPQNTRAETLARSLV